MGEEERRALLAELEWIYKLLPKQQHIAVRCYNKDGVLQYVISQNPKDPEWFYFFKVDSDKLTKLGRAHDPNELEAKYANKE